MIRGRLIVRTPEQIRNMHTPLHRRLPTPVQRKILNLVLARRSGNKFQIFNVIIELIASDHFALMVAEVAGVLRFDVVFDSFTANGVYFLFVLFDGGELTLFTELKVDCFLEEEVESLSG